MASVRAPLCAPREGGSAVVEIAWSSYEAVGMVERARPLGRPRYKETAMRSRRRWKMASAAQSCYKAKLSVALTPRTATAELLREKIQSTFPPWPSSAMLSWKCKAGKQMLRRVWRRRRFRIG